jgi:vacuolar protein sorting-associated protein 13A/C
VSFEAPAADTVLSMASQAVKGEETHVGLSWTEGLGKYKLTKVITLVPRFFLKNNLTQAISYRQHAIPPREGSIIVPGERCALHSMQAQSEKLFTIAFSGLDAQWYEMDPFIFLPFNIFFVMKVTSNQD